MALAQQIQQLHDATPGWVHWLVIGGTWAVSFLQPLALFVTVVYGGMQIYGWIVNKGWQRKRK